MAGGWLRRDIKAAVAAVTIEDRLHSELQWRTDHPGLPEFMFAW